MSIINSSTFSVAPNGDLRQNSAFIPGTSAPHSTLELHAWLQDLADNAAPSGDDNVSILGTNPSELAGKRNSSRPMALTLLNGVNLDDSTAQWFHFGSVEQQGGSVLYTGLKSIGTVVASSPIYIIQSAAKVAKYWTDGHIQILLKAKTGGSLIDSGNATVYSRKYGQTYSHFDVNLAAGGEQSAALSTAIDSNISLSELQASTIFSTITVVAGDSTNDLGGGQGALLHKGMITLNGTTTLADAYQALQWATSENSTATLVGVPGFRYRVLNAAYPENAAAPFGSFAGGKFFVAQGWWLTGVMASDSKNYELISHTGVVETPPNSVTVEVSGVVAGDYVLVARDSGSDILSNEYTVSTIAGSTSLNITGLKADTPVSGVIRINGSRYTYTSWTGTTLSGVSPSLPTTSNVSAFIPLIDAVASGASISSASMQFTAPFTCRYRVRNGGASPVVPFESTLSVTSTGGSGTAVRNPDA